MNHINFNGKILPAETPLVNADNRGLRFGDGLFETLKYRNGAFVLLDEHLARLWHGMKLMQFQLPKLFTPDLLEKQLFHLIDKNKIQHARVRINIFRGNGGLYDAINHQPQYTIETWPLNEQSGKFNENGLYCCIYHDIKKNTDPISNCKHNNFLPYVMGALYAQQQQCNDALILNTENCICDSTIANIFWIKNSQLFTPPLSAGCIAGIIRSEIIRTLKGTEHEVKESSMTKEALMDADEVFLTNSIHELRWVCRIESKQYDCHQTMVIRNLLQQTNPSVFC